MADAKQPNRSKNESLLASIRLPERRPRVPDQIAHALRVWIVEEGTPGDMLPTERELVKRFGVARPTVREALRILQAEGLVEIRRGVNGGAVVQPPEVHQLAIGVGVFLQRIGATMSEVFSLRLLIEPEAARRAALRADAEHVATLLDEVLDDEVRALDRREPAHVSRRIVDFHNVVLALSGDQVLATVGELLENVVVMQNTRSLSTTDEPAEWASSAHLAHTKIAGAIKAGDADRAAGLSRKHLEASAQLIFGDRGELPVNVISVDGDAGSNSHEHWPAEPVQPVHATNSHERS